MLCRVVLCSVVSNSLLPHGLQPTRLPCLRGLSRQEYWCGLPCPPPGESSNPRIEPRSPSLQGDSLPSESPEKLKNTRVGNLSLLQGNFPAQRLNWYPLHCRQILYHLSHQGSQIYLNLTPFSFFGCTTLLEGNGTLLQYSCLENPMDGGVWWAAVHGVARGWT